MFLHNGSVMITTDRNRELTGHVINCVSSSLSGNANLVRLLSDWSIALNICKHFKRFCCCKTEKLTLKRKRKRKENT